MFVVVLNVEYEGKRPKLTVLTSEGEDRCPLIGFVDT
jgi:hypothetical protein